MQGKEFSFKIIRINHNCYVVDGKKYTYLELIRWLENILTEEGKNNEMSDMQR
jgi:hypothetical protein